VYRRGMIIAGVLDVKRCSALPSKRVLSGSSSAPRDCTGCAMSAEATSSTRSVRSPELKILDDTEYYELAIVHKSFT